MTVWHWVRHAPTHQKCFVGWRDVPADLSQSEQIKRLNRHLPQRALLVSSDLIRAVETADALMQLSRPRLPHQPGLRELHFGVWDGLHFSEVSARHPTLSRAYWEAPGTPRPPGGESWDMASERVQTVVGQINSWHQPAEVIAVAHFGAILTQVHRAIGGAAYDVLAHRIDNLSVTTIKWQEGKAEVVSINHLP